ncbi:hypothetical protein, partial [Anaerobutyricum soehngenii]|uniref:hypothetical protein n=1 Tax=Anaerobutyricum soehngenii TaxID=105843 RepID=UPI001ADDCEA8
MDFLLHDLLWWQELPVALILYVKRLILPGMLLAALLYQTLIKNEKHENLRKTNFKNVSVFLKKYKKIINAHSGSS